MSSSPDESCADWQPMARGPTPEEALVVAETVESLLTGFDEQEQEIVGLRLQAYSEREISEQVGRSERTVRRVLERLRRRVERVYEQGVVK
ncbi:MAG TPA: helix-turn-helix domain-containing protein [Pirellulales bacterium]|nr:helix-turn-helix domain-containing protein [Pirellulales bacterium]